MWVQEGLEVLRSSSCALFFFSTHPLPGVCLSSLLWKRASPLTSHLTGMGFERVEDYRTLGSQGLSQPKSSRGVSD